MKKILTTVLAISLLSLTAYATTQVIADQVKSSDRTKTWTMPTVTGTIPITTQVPSQLITGYTSGAGTVSATDSILQAIQKLNGNTSAVSGSAVTSLTGEATGTGPGATAVTLTNSAVIGKVLTGYSSGAGTVSASDSILSAINKLNGNTSAVSGSAITSLTGEVTASGPGAAAATLSTTAVTGKALTGFVSGAGTVSATDSILSAINKLDGTDALKVPLTRTISTTAPITGGGDLSANRTIACNVASGSQPGCLASADFTTFNAKGDFSSNTATSVDGEMILFSGTGGKTGKRSTLTGGLLKSTSGVPSIAVSGTDYAPATSGSALQLGNGAGGFSGYAGHTCTNQSLTALSSTGTGTCTTITSAYVNNSIAQTGVDINTSHQVTVTHLASALPFSQGGLGISTATSGGVPYFSSTSAVASSGLLSQYQVVLGGGAGAAPTVVAGTGTAGQVLTSNGASANPTFQTAGGGGSTVYSFSGNHGSDCAWSKVSAGYGNPAAGDASCTFSTVQNTNFGTVTSYNTGVTNTNYPGIVISPPVVGEYFVCAVIKQVTHTQVQNFGFELTDTSTVIAQQYGTTATTGDNFAFGVTLCGLYHAASTGSTTLRMEFNNFGGTGSQDNFGPVYWSIYKVN